MKKSDFFTLIVLLFTCSLFAQTNNIPRNFAEENPFFLVNKISEKITVDGILDEPAWQKCAVQKNFSQKFPTDSLQANGDTEVRMIYDSENLYVATKCHSKGNNWIIPSLKRDYGFMGTDNISLVFDTFNDKTNAVLFGMNPLGARREATITEGGRDNQDFSNSWDNKWLGESKIYNNYWVAEFVIPFKSLRFEEDCKTWRFNTYRFDTQHNEITSWINIPINFSLTDLTYMGEMVWEEPLSKTGKNVSIIPYVSGGINRDFEDLSEVSPQSNIRAGGDVKIGITSGLNLDLTLNPDFSQVEVDRQVTNLSRFEIFFPERRQFFLENADLFSNFSSSRANPFFSRRIGVAYDTETETNVENTILYGARLSGKLNERTRIGLLNMQTAAQPNNYLPSYNYSVGVLEKTVFTRSNISFIAINKQAIKPQNFGNTFNSYNRIIGGDYNFTSDNNNWSAKLSSHYAITPETLKDKMSQFARVEYAKRNYRFEMLSAFIGAGYNAEVGFVPRKDVFFISPEFALFFYPENEKHINQHSLDFDATFIYKVGNDDNEILQDWTITDKHVELQWNIRFKNFSNFSIRGEIDNTVLFNDFDPTRVQKDDIFLEEGTSYNYGNLSLDYNSDRRAKISYSLSTNLGQFFNGFRTGISGNANLRLQPYGTVSLNFNYNYIELDAPFVPANLWLIGPRFDLTFSKKLFLTTFIQYNNQLENLNINARLQWRFKPVSDVFLVFTDNYLTYPFQDLGSRNRAIVAKVTYWFNL